MEISGTYDIEYSDTLEVSPSPIHGHGVFATVAFTSGDLIMNSLGVNSYKIYGMISQSRFGANVDYVTTLVSGPPMILHTSKSYMPTNEFRFLNNNVANSNVSVVNNFSTYATQDIAIGEELTLNYSVFGFYD